MLVFYSVCFVCGLISPISWLFLIVFYAFNLWSVPGFIISNLVVVFNFLIVLFLSQPVHLI
jgi:hypothetical protein